jgi:hypothetical protein
MVCTELFAHHSSFYNAVKQQQECFCYLSGENNHV